MRSQSSAQSSRRGETMKRTEKSKANITQKSKANSRQNCSKANSRQKSKANIRQKSKANSRQNCSKANSRQKSIANGRQSKPKDCDRDKDDLLGETQYRRKLQSASPEASMDRCRCPGGATGAEDTSKDVIRRRSSPERIDEQIVDVRVPLPILKESVTVMKLTPHEHAPTGPDGPAGAENNCAAQAVHQQGWWRSRDDAETNPTV